jgi:hypothetical protein
MLYEVILEYSLGRIYHSGQKRVVSARQRMITAIETNEDASLPTVAFSSLFS